jgi:hypothetical protein
VEGGAGPVGAANDIRQLDCREEHERHVAQAGLLLEFFAELLAVVPSDVHIRDNQIDRQAPCRLQASRRIRATMAGVTGRGKCLRDLGAGRQLFIDDQHRSATFQIVHRIVLPTNREFMICGGILVLRVAVGQRPHKPLSKDSAAAARGPH